MRDQDNPAKHSMFSQLLFTAQAKKTKAVHYNKRKIKHNMRAAAAYMKVDSRENQTKHGCILLV